MRERARPLLGTIVRIRVPETPDADRVIDAAFVEVVAVHDAMSFQSPTSDLSRIGRATPGVPVPISAHTRACLSAALRWSCASDGAFDPVATVTSDASHCDLALEDDGVVVARPLAIDLSGIAKGYAVDRAIDCLAAAGIDRAVVDAGGDLRVLGSDEETVALRPSIAAAAPAMVIIADGALASSDPALARRQFGAAQHRDGRSRRLIAGGFVAVAAPACLDADALTKIVLALGDAAAPLLGDSIAYRHDGRTWSTIAGGAAAR